MKKFLHNFAVTCFTVFTLLSCSLFKSNADNSNSSKPERQVIDVTPPEINEAEIVEGTEIGNSAPEIELENPQRNTIKLSSLRGKMVLVDFWAAWCGPCRRENPNLVRAYEKYNRAQLKNASGFEIYSISLDRNKDTWVKAIKDDELNWEYHVSDLKFWNSEAAKTYGINSIPFNLLLDANGVIVAKNLRGIILDKTMDEYVEKF